MGGLRALLSIMPNFKKHVTVGAGVGCGLNLAYQLFKLYTSDNPPKDFWEALSQVNFLEVGVFAAIGAGCAALPDLLEPATTPNHREAFHSLACGGLVGYGAFGKHTEDLTPDERHGLQVAALSYLSHLFLDSQTPRSLPLVGIRLPATEI